MLRLSTFASGFHRKGVDLASLCAGWAGAKELQFMVEIAVASGELDLFFKLVNGAGSLDRLDGSTVGADQVVAVFSGDNQGEIGGTLMQSKAAQDALVRETLQ